MTSIRKASPFGAARAGTLLLGLALLGGCKESLVPDFNAPSEPDYLIVKSRPQLQAQVTGLVDDDRQVHGFQILVQETVGRDLYRIDGAEPRYITTPLGPVTPGTTNFIQAGNFTGPYRIIRYSNQLISATQNAAIPELLSPLSEGEKQSVYGFAQTFKALEYMRLYETRDTIGLPVIVGLPGELPPIRCTPAVLEAIAATLDSGMVNLLAADEDFPFELPSGFRGAVGSESFDTPAQFAKFNRALKAKLEVYRGFLRYRDGQAIDLPALARAKSALDSSFYNRTGDLLTGVYHSYSSAAGDTPNPLFDKTVYRINPRVVLESENARDTVLASGDTVLLLDDLRVSSKVNTDRASVVRNLKGIRGVSSGYLDKVFNSPLSPIAIIRNAELVYLDAEIAFGQGDYARALTLVNYMRQREGGLPALSETDLGGFTTAEGRLNLVRQILYNKRYSLLLESVSRHVDYRMFGILNELGQERDNDPIAAFRIPANESLARQGELTCS